MADSIAQNYFENFTGPDGAAVLSELPGTHPKTFEDNWLDFKSGRTRPEDLENIWSKALGAMANAGGGVVVWGIAAKKHGKPPVDAAESLELVPDVNAFASRLNEILRFATDPPIVGVQVKAIPEKDGSPEGFVICLVPEGKVKPYQSLKSKKPFYLRVGDESKEPPLPILRQLFNPQLTTKAKAVVKVEEYDKSNSIHRKITVTLKNFGPNSIEYGFVTISSRFATLSQNADLFRTSQRIQLGVSSVYLHPDFDETFTFYASGAYEKSDFTLTLYQAHQAAQVAKFDCSFRNHAFMEKSRFFYAEQIEVAFVIPSDGPSAESSDA